MFRTPAPAPQHPAGRADERTLSVTRVVARSVGPGTTPLDDPASVAFFPEQARAGGVALDHEILTHGRGNTFTDLASAVLPQLVGDAEVQLVVLAHAAPDLVVGDVASLIVASRLAGEPMAFAVTEQGTATVFTALTLAGLYARAHPVDRVVVLALDQALFPYHAVCAPGEQLHGDAVVGLLLERRDGAGVQVSQRAGLAAATDGEVRAAITHLVAQLAGDSDARVLLGAGAAAAAGHDMRPVAYRAVPGYPSTGVWSGLAGAADQGEAFLLVDYDPVHGQLSGCRIDGAPEVC